MAAEAGGTSGIVVQVVVAGLVTALGSLFAAGDAALSEIPDGRMLALAAEPGADGEAFRRFTADPLRILSRWLVGRVVALSAATVLLTQAAGGLGRGALFVAVLGVVLFYGTCAEIVGTLARRRPERVGALALVFLRPLEWLLIPLANPLAIVGRAVGRRVPKSHLINARMTETEVEYVVSEGERAGAMAREPAEMIRKVLDFKDLTAREVMVPRAKIDGISVGTPLAEVIAAASDGKHSRYPVYRENLDNVVGQLYVKDLFAVVRDGGLATRTLADLVRSPVMFVSENQPAAKILADMRSRRLHMAIVSDEFGGTAGLVTLEDILEEIVGDIRDEKDAEAPFQSMEDGRVVVDASMSIADLEHALGKQLPADGEFESVGGLIVSRAGRVPKVGTTLRVDGLNLIVREADEKRVVKVEIVPDSAAPRDGVMSGSVPTPSRGVPEGAHEIRLDATEADLESPAEVAAQLPLASTRPPGSAVVVAPVASKKRGALGRLLGDGKVKVSLVARCTALLACGYVDIAASGDRAWGVAPG